MIRQYKLNEIAVSDILNRDIMAERGVEEIVDEIIANVRRDGDAALLAYCEKFDKARLTSLEVSEQEIEEAMQSLDADFIRTLEIARDNISAFHQQQIQKNFVITQQGGIVLGQKYTAVEKAGLYVPGGTASYPSSVLMNAVPAKLAGVSEIVMTTPPNSEGKIAPAILAAARVAGVTRIFKVGGAQAVAALAYGTESVPKVDKIVGPGNIFVATAKRRVVGMVDIDMIDGPSEILVLADGSCNPAYVAADMLSQAEHDKLATAVLITTSAELAQKVSDELERQIPLLPREEIARTSIDTNGKIIIADTMEEAVAAANIIAPEHLEVCVDEPFALLDSIKNAGSIFLGKNVPEALGDYLAGPNHTLPTSGTARFSSPLSVDDFVKKSSFIYYPKDALAKVADRIVDFAEREGLGAHARSVSIRFDADFDK
ncbi:MAG: histidinol dehydrogenase [Firmicutes bacterium]|nr:histidinol dehydrogenase [Bacillota bacterium]